MHRHRVMESGISSMSSEDYDLIEPCPCDDDDDDDDDHLPSQLAPLNPYLDAWEPIIIYRKDKRKHRSGRCLHSRRLVLKDGRAASLHRAHAPLRYARYLRDLGNTVVNGRWRWVTLALVATVSTLWLLFAWLWMLVAAAHGDLDPAHPPPDNQTCTVGVQGFAGFLLMSIETQTTIGYGSRYPTETCPGGVFLLCLQMILAIGVEGAVLGMFYVKMTRPRRRDSHKLFSRIAVVCQRDGALCLMFRVRDRERAHIVGTQLRAYLVEPRRCDPDTSSSSAPGTPRGAPAGGAVGGVQVPGRGVEPVECVQRPLKLEPVGLLLWPLTVVHRITDKSPLFDVSARDLLVRKFEIVVTMVGSSDSTGQLTQSRASYLASEIHWGHRFKPCVRYDEDAHSYVVHEELLGATETVDTPLCSAQRLQEVLAEIHHQKESPDTASASASTSGVTSAVMSRVTSPSASDVTSGFQSGVMSSVTSSPTVYLDEILETDV